MLIQLFEDGVDHSPSMNGIESWVSHKDDPISPIPSTSIRLVFQLEVTVEDSEDLQLPWKTAFFFPRFGREMQQSLIF